MKILWLLRHAKTEPAGQKEDFKRILTERGVSDISRVAEHFFSQYSLPERILCSSAFRTVETIELFLQESSKPVQNHTLTFHKSLYLASPSEILDTIDEEANDANSILIVGHNFGISQLAALLSESSVEEMPTSALIGFQFQEKIQASKGKLIQYFQAKKL